LLRRTFFHCFEIPPLAGEVPFRPSGPVVSDSGCPLGPCSPSTLGVLAVALLSPSRRVVFGCFFSLFACLSTPVLLLGVLFQEAGLFTPARVLCWRFADLSSMCVFDLRSVALYLVPGRLSAFPLRPCPCARRCGCDEFATLMQFCGFFHTDASWSRLSLSLLHSFRSGFLVCEEVQLPSISRHAGAL